jgi:hypothetical protein
VVVVAVEQCFKITVILQNTIGNIIEVNLGK